MKLALAVLLTSASAWASVKPAGWKLVGLDAHAKDTSVVDAATKSAVSEQYLPDESDPGITLYVTRATASDLKTSREVAIAALADELRTHGPVTQTGTDQLVLTASWRDAEVHTQRTTRLVIAADATHLITVTGECIARDDVAAVQVDACKAALATLDSEVAKADRVALALPAAVVVTPPPPASPTLEPARLDDGSRVPFAPIVVPPAPTATDRRPIYVGAGVVLLALAFWWNRKQRDRFEREEGPTPPRRRARSGAPDRATPPNGGDADADDLHAAATDVTDDKQKEDVDDR